ncbi:putative mediator of RNA polymerase II transcription subunit 26 [Chelonus insularis]|uniref:putative mediator of RNA polymerase II transcription subunit 26 n=1 Tax=Chelonus insularis TaxID=460826 RepID=UPI00158E0456|nr:putative mediator of RNA polymerase II transcription subunit 26 [Chelonus insularis]XP_034949083.1 putative mediator of RNA polymerase II transcription subunit 26 [Chelonus insularis]
MDKKNTLIQKEQFNTLKSKITIKLIGDANDLSELVSDINSEYHLNAEFNKQAPVKTKSELNFEPSKKKLKMKEEILAQRVVLVVPKNSSLNYPSPKHENKLTSIENQKRNFETSLQLQDPKIKNYQQNNNSCTQNTVEDDSKKNLSMNGDKDTNSDRKKLLDLTVNFREGMKKYKNEHKKLNHNIDNVNLKQVTDSQPLSKQLNEETNRSFESVCDINKVQTIEKPFQSEDSLTKPLKRKFSVAQNIIHSNISTQKLKNTLQPVPKRNPTQDTFILNRLTPLKILHSPIVLRKSHPTNYFKQNKLSKEEKKATTNTDSVHAKTMEDNTSSSSLFNSHIETTDSSTESKLANIATENQSSKDIKTNNSLLHKTNFDSSLNPLETSKTTTELSLPEKNSITTKDQKQPPKNTKVDISLHTYSLNSKLSESNAEVESKIQQTIVPSEAINSKTIQPILDKKEESLSQKLNNHECTNNLKTPENKKYCVSISPNKILHETCNKKQLIKSPQVKVNGLMIRAPDRNLLNNPALKEKIQEFRLSNKPFEKVSSILIKNTQHESKEQKNNSVTLPEVSESLVSTTTVESGQSDKNIKDCQCEQLRQEVNEQWKIITSLRSRINKSLNTSQKECDSFIEEKSQTINDEHILEMLVKELEETNRKITENLRREQIRNKKLKLTLKHKNIRIKQLESKLKTVSKIFEETEKSVVCLRNLMQSSNGITHSILSQNNIYKR